MEENSQEPLKTGGVIRETFCKLIGKEVEWTLTHNRSIQSPKDLFDQYSAQVTFLMTT